MDCAQIWPHAKSIQTQWPPIKLVRTSINIFCVILCEEIMSHRPRAHITTMWSDMYEMWLIYRLPHISLHCAYSITIYIHKHKYNLVRCRSNAHQM